MARQQIKQDKKEIRSIIEKWKNEDPRRAKFFDDDDALEKINAEKSLLPTVLKHRKLQRIYECACALSFLGIIVTFFWADSLRVGEFSTLMGALTYNLRFIDLNFIPAINVFTAVMILLWFLFGALSKVNTIKIKKLTSGSLDERQIARRYNKKTAPILDRLTADIKYVNELKAKIATAEEEIRKAVLENRAKARAEKEIAKPGG